MPDSIEARRNLAVALYRQDKFEDALKQFQEVLKSNPGDALALKYVENLRSRTSISPPN